MMSRTQAERPLLERRRGSSARLEEIQRRKCQSQAVLRSSWLPLMERFVHQPRAELWVDILSVTPSLHAMLPLRKLGPEKLPTRSPSQ